MKTRTNSDEMPAWIIWVLCGLMALLPLAVFHDLFMMGAA